MLLDCKHLGLNALEAQLSLFFLLLESLHLLFQLPGAQLDVAANFKGIVVLALIDLHIGKKILLRIELSCTGLSENSFVVAKLLEVRFRVSHGSSKMVDKLFSLLEKATAKGAKELFA
jgi:hypothetical protein